EQRAAAGPDAAGLPAPLLRRDRDVPAAAGRDLAVVRHLVRHLARPLRPSPVTCAVSTAVLARPQGSPHRLTKTSGFRYGPRAPTGLALWSARRGVRHDQVMQREWVLEESVVVAAPPERVYDAVADLRRMGEWSPETFAIWVRD